MLIMGEVQTGMLRGPGPLDSDEARRRVGLLDGEPVFVSERPQPYVRSPERAVGVDCPVVESRSVRGIGTVSQRVVIIGGHVVQGSAFATLVPAGGGARRPWEHYLAHLGRIETIGSAGWAELADAFAAPLDATTALDLGALASRAADRVQAASGPVRLRSARTRLRWVARLDADAGPQRVRFVVRRDGLRLLQVTTTEATADRLAALGEDVALHDWLLTALIEIVRKAALGIVPRTEALDRLMPAVDHLLHLWMPGMRGDEFTEGVWAVLERHAGFSRQWDTLVHRIRDQLSLGALAALSAGIPR